MRFNGVYPTGFIKHGWKILKLNGGLNRKITKCHIFHCHFWLPEGTIWNFNLKGLLWLGVSKSSDTSFLSKEKPWMGPQHRCLRSRCSERGRSEIASINTGWLVTGTWFVFFHILGISSSQLTNSYFSEEWLYHQPVIIWRTRGPYRSKPLDIHGSMGLFSGSLSGQHMHSIRVSESGSTSHFQSLSNNSWKISDGANILLYPMLLAGLEAQFQVRGDDGRCKHLANRQGISWDVFIYFPPSDRFSID